MKKLILSVAVTAVALMMACTGKEQAKKEDGGIMAKIENCTNTDSLKAYVEQAKAYAQTLVSEGKVDQAKEFLAKIEPMVKQKAPALASALTSVETALDKVESAVGEKADSAKQAVTDSVEGMFDAAKQAVSDKASEAAGKAAVAVESVPSDNIYCVNLSLRDHAPDQTHHIMKRLTLTIAGLMAVIAAWSGCAPDTPATTTDINMIYIGNSIIRGA